MKIVITTNQGKSVNILSKISMFFLGTFLTAITWLFLSKFLGEYGLIAGLLLMTVLIFFGFKKTQKSSNPRFVIYGMLATTAFASALIIGFFILIKIA
ncbi:hypothetical protein M0P48_04145 [Candidatus Gracilibacteria bacterium]|nr:hypothetical protein [Candidatus Gracilibacteria bacterium]